MKEAKKIPQTDSAYWTTESKHNTRRSSPDSRPQLTNWLTMCDNLTFTSPSPAPPHEFYLPTPLKQNYSPPSPASCRFRIQIHVLRFLQWCHSSRTIKHSRQPWDSRQLFVVKWSHTITSTLFRHHCRVVWWVIAAFPQPRGSCRGPARLVKVDELNKVSRNLYLCQPVFLLSLQSSVVFLGIS